MAELSSVRRQQGGVGRVPVTESALALLPLSPCLTLAPEQARVCSPCLGPLLYRMGPRQAVWGPVGAVWENDFENV